MFKNKLAWMRKWTQSAFGRTEAGKPLEIDACWLETAPLVLCDGHYRRHAGGDVSGNSV